MYFLPMVICINYVQMHMITKTILGLYLWTICKEGNRHVLPVLLLDSVRGSNLERPIPDLRACFALQGANTIFYAFHIEFWTVYCLAEKENQLRWSSLSLCGKGLSVGRSRVNGRGAAVNAAAASCGALRRRQCSRSPLYQPWHSFLSVPTHSYILCSTVGKLALVSFRCSFSSTFSRPC